MFKVALDILPAQAFSVPCERIFSSSKETCTLRRNILSAALLEVRQVLKHLYKQERLDFMSQWVSRKEDYSIEYATETAINELVSSGKSDELVDLLRSMESSSAYWTFRYFASWTISPPPNSFFHVATLSKKGDGVAQFPFLWLSNLFTIVFRVSLVYPVRDSTVRVQFDSDSGRTAATLGRGRSRKFGHAQGVLKAEPESHSGVRNPCCSCMTRDRRID